jgi:hypothetical protein
VFDALALIPPAALPPDAACSECVRMLTYVHLRISEKQACDSLPSIG